MNKAFDILLNFESVPALPFYEWKESDDLLHATKLGFVKVSNKLFKEIKEYDGRLDLSNIELLKPVYEKEIEGSPLIILSDVGVIGVLIDENGLILKRSGLLLDEEKELMELCSIVNEVNIKFDKRKRIEYDYNLTKYENEMLNTYYNEIKKGSLDKLKYWYYEITGNEESNDEKVISYLKKINDIEAIRKLTININTINSN